MKINSLSRVTIRELIKNQIGAIFVASGYESRARAFATYVNKFKNVNVGERYAWGFEEHQEYPIRLKNDAILQKMGYKTELYSGNDSDAIEEQVVNYLLGSKSDPVSVVFDISSMTRSWYGAVVRAMSRFTGKKHINSYFVYYPARWSKPIHPYFPNEILGPVPGFASLSLPNKPTALVIGLGIEPWRALGLRDYLDAQEVKCFYTDPSIDERYVNSVFEANFDFFETINKSDIFKYNIYDSFSTYNTLKSVCHGLIRKYRIVLSSLGPKIFGLFCFLIANELSDISVWRVSPASKQPPYDHKATKFPIIVEVVWN